MYGVSSEVRVEVSTTPSTLGSLGLAPLNRTLKLTLTLFILRID